jgi:nickel/cobalt transporter (NiCoT) family protein
LSFDTLSQALLFSTSASRFHGWRSAAILGGLFTLGMVLLDGLNGAWMARLLDRADATAKAVSRALGALVAFLSLLVAAGGIFRLLSTRGNPALEPQAGTSSYVLLALVVSFAVLLMIWQPACRFLRSLLRRPA